MNKVILIFGPTAVQKSKIAISLSESIGEIINADSMQIYKGLDVGTAKLKKTQRNNIPHHLIDIVNPNENYSVYDFMQDSIKLIKKIHKKNKIPFVVGGTALYFKALTEGLLKAPSKDNQIRDNLNKKIATNKDNLHDLLSKIDKKAASKIHPSDTNRIIRAIEVYTISKVPISDLWDKHQKDKFKTGHNFNFLKIGLTMPREDLYQIINKRCVNMIENGIIEEAKMLKDRGYSYDLPAMKAIGYRHFLRYLSGFETYQNTENLFKRDTRRFAKRQWTFFKSFKNVNWFTVDQVSFIRKIIDKFINIQASI